MKYAIVLGSNIFIGTNGILSFDNGVEQKDFFRIREIHNERSPGSHLGVDVDIKNVDGTREIKLFKSKPVAVGNHNLSVACDRNSTVVTDDDGSLIISIEQHTDVPENVSAALRRVNEHLAQPITVDAVLTINGKFNADGIQIEADEKGIVDQNGNRFSGNIKVGSGGIIFKQGGGFAF